MKIPVLTAFLAAAATSHAAIIFSDSFSTAGDLDGMAPDTRPGTETWSALTTAPVTTVAGGNATSTASTTSYLRWTPAAGNIYSLSVDIRFTMQSSSTSNFAGLGFFNEGANNGNHYAGATATTPWAFIRGANTDSNLIGDVDVRSTGNNTAAGDKNYDPTVSHNLQLILNTNDTNAGTAGSQFSLMFLVDGIQIGSTKSYDETQSDGLLTSITKIGVTNATGSSNAVFYDNFMLQTIPEPSAALLGALGALALLRRRR